MKRSPACQYACAWVRQSCMYVCMYVYIHVYALFTFPHDIAKWREFCILICAFECGCVCVCYVRVFYITSEGVELCLLKTFAHAYTCMTPTMDRNLPLHVGIYTCGDVAEGRNKDKVYTPFSILCIVEYTRVCTLTHVHVQIGWANESVFIPCIVVRAHTLPHAPREDLWL
jgi:hypothetical protein